MSDRPTLDADSPRQPPAGALKIIFFIVMMDLFGFGIIIPLLPFYIPGYNSNALTQTFQVTMLFSVYSICQFIGAPILGLISDRFGRRPVLIVSQAGSAAGYVLLALATQVHWHSAAMTLTLVYLSRVIDGFTGGNISTAQAYVSDVTTRETRSKGMGMLGAAFGIGFVLGPIVGGLLGSVNKSLPAYVAAAMAGGAALVSYLRLPESRVHAPTEAEVWLHPRKFLPILRKSVLVQLLAISFFTMAAFVMMESTVALFLNHRFTWSIRQIGFYFCYIGVVIIGVQGGLIGRLTKKFGDWPLAAAGPMLVSVGMLAYIATGFHPVILLLLVAGGINAMGRSFQQPTLSSLLSKFSDEKEQGAVFGLYHGLGSLARVAGPIVAAPTYLRLHNTGQFLTAGILTAITGAWTLALRRRAGAPPRHINNEVIPMSGEPHAVREEPA